MSLHPVGCPPSRLAASGKDVAVREGAREWEASGQYALPLAPRAVSQASCRDPEVGAGSRDRARALSTRAPARRLGRQCRPCRIPRGAERAGRSPRGEDQPRAIAPPGRKAERSRADVSPGADVERASCHSISRCCSRISSGKRKRSRRIAMRLRKTRCWAMRTSTCPDCTRKRIGRARRCGTCWPIRGTSRVSGTEPDGSGASQQETAQASPRAAATAPPANNDCPARTAHPAERGGSRAQVAQRSVPCVSWMSPIRLSRSGDARRRRLARSMTQSPVCGISLPPGIPPVARRFQPSMKASGGKFRQRRIDSLHRRRFVGFRAEESRRRCLKVSP